MERRQEAGREELRLLRRRRRRVVAWLEVSHRLRHLHSTHTAEKPERKRLSQMGYQTGLILLNGGLPKRSIRLSDLSTWAQGTRNRVFSKYPPNN